MALVLPQASSADLLQILRTMEGQPENSDKVDQAVADRPPGQQLDDRAIHSREVEGIPARTACDRSKREYPTRSRLFPRSVQGFWETPLGQSIGHPASSVWTIETSKGRSPPGCCPADEMVYEGCQETEIKELESTVPAIPTTRQSNGRRVMESTLVSHDSVPKGTGFGFKDEDAACLGQSKLADASSGRSRAPGRLEQCRETTRDPPAPDLRSRSNSSHSNRRMPALDSRQKYPSSVEGSSVGSPRITGGVGGSTSESAMFSSEASSRRKGGSARQSLMSGRKEGNAVEAAPSWSTNSVAGTASRSKLEKRIRPATGMSPSMRGQGVG